MVAFAPASWAKPHADLCKRLTGWLAESVDERHAVSPETTASVRQADDSGVRVVCPAGALACPARHLVWPELLVSND